MNKYPKVNIKSRYGLGLGRHCCAGEDTIVYKKAGFRDSTKPWRSQYRYVIVKLLIPEGTRVYLTHSKCRAAKAIVLEIKAVGRTQRFNHAQSGYMIDFTYIVGETVKPTRRFSIDHEECESGIHFFRTLAEAKAY